MTEKKKLTAKEEMFCLEYGIDFNGARAARDAGYSENTAKEIASNLLTKVNIRERIKGLLADRVGNLELTSERVGQELAAIAYAKLSDVGQWDAEGNLILLPTCMIPEAVLPAIQSIKKIVTADGERLEIKMHDKTKVLEMIAKHAKFFEEPAPPPNVINNNFLSDLPTHKLSRICDILNEEDE
ncbi:MAG: terminase small subunit [Candidatus Anammoxibacter sp.]